MKKFNEPYFEIINLSDVDVVCTSGEYGLDLPDEGGENQD